MVPQIPNDETASIPLERIRVERSECDTEKMKIEGVSVISNFDWCVFDATMRQLQVGGKQ